MGDPKVSAERLSRARTVLQYAPDLADNVLTGATSLDAAYQVARKRNDDAATGESRLADLRARYPELADQVVEGELTLAGALAEAQRAINEREPNAPTSFSPGSQYPKPH